MPLYLWLVTEVDLFREWWVVMPWVVFTASLMISSIATFNWSSIRLRREWRLPALAFVGLLGAAIITAPWQTLIAIVTLYLASIPFSILSYAKVKRLRQAKASDAASGRGPDA
jgi:CDP-diacylglycerol--serine O-phosphatidyltransferase